MAAERKGKVMWLALNYKPVLEPEETGPEDEKRILEELSDFGEELKEHILSYKNLAVRLSSLSAWRLLLTVLEKEGKKPGRITFDETGKPGFADQDNVFLSIAHSGPLCAAAASSVPVGADVELIRPAYKPSLVDRCLSKQEKALFQEDFTRAWCRKEAVSKLTGEGIFMSPERIDILSDEYGFVEKVIEYKEERYRMTAAFLPEP